MYLTWKLILNKIILIPICRFWFAKILNGRVVQIAYTAQYDTTDVTNAGIDGFAVVVITLVGLAGIIVLVLIAGYFMKQIKKFR